MSKVTAETTETAFVLCYDFTHNPVIVAVHLV